MSPESKSHLDAFQSYNPIPWNMIPDLGLYMDQVITLISRVYEPLYGPDPDRYLSSSMINNYVKSKLIPRPASKKYGRDQIALLCMIVALKQTASMEDIRSMLSIENGLTVEEMYTLFCSGQQKVIQSMLAPDDVLDSGLPPAMAMALVSSGYRAGCEMLLRAENNPPTSRDARK